jgi:hypothetical protein
MELADRILRSVENHRWEGSPDSPTGPFHLPTSQGKLFTPRLDQAAA